MWTSGGAILRDLSRAQGGAGRGAHAELRALRPRDRPPPPPPWLCAEMEEYVRGLAPAPPAAAACEGGPDLRHIQQMLDMVRKLNIAEEEMANDEALVRDLDSYTIESSRSTELSRAELAGPANTVSPAARALGAGHELPEPRKHKKRRRRNIALESILQALENNERNDGINCSSEPFTLLTPQDLTTKFTENINNSTDGTSTGQTNDKDTGNTSSYNKIDSNDKVNHWMNQMMSPIQTKSQSKRIVREAIRLDPLSMFKKKVKVDFAKLHSKVNSEAAFKKEESPANGSAPYVPPAAAAHEAALCYQRYLENNKLLQIRREEASQLAVLITEALERAAQVEAMKRAVLEEAPEREALEGCPERSALEEARERSALEEAPERSALEEARERLALEEAPERSALEEAPERSALEEARERLALEEAPERSALEEAAQARACVEWGVARALRVAPASARLAEPRACGPRAPCLVCARLTRAEPPPEPACFDGRAGLF